MPLKQASDYGTNANNSVNEDYCVYCYKEGEFTQDCTMDEMIQHCAQFVEEFNKDAEVHYTKEQVITQMKEFFPQLKRWKSA